jgi:2-C-methyl-D-erythritol 4-phosphate cytidylyltransferase
MNIAVILAGYRKSIRKSAKSNSLIAGKMVLEHAVDALRKNILIDEIAVVVNEHYIFMIEDMILKTNGPKCKYFSWRSRALPF